MSRWFRLPLLSLIALPVSTTLAATFGPLVAPDELSARLQEVKPIVLDIRVEEYENGHLPGAISAPYGQFRGPADNPGQLLDEATLEQRFEELGLDPEQAIVIVTDGETDTDFGAAARVYWTLKSSGFDDLSILNGGHQAWQAQGFDVDTEASTLPPTDLDITFSRQWTADTDEVAASTQADAGALLLDARPAEFYDGQSSHPAAAKPGTLPGAQNASYTRFFDSGSASISQSPDTASLLEKLGVEPGEEIVSFCNTGHWAATNWFALSELGGLENVKLYPGSVVEYSNAGHELENTPGLVENFLNKLRGH